MKPPQGKDPVTGIGWSAADAALPKWTIDDTFDSAADCGLQQKLRCLNDEKGLIKLNEEGTVGLSRP